MPRMGRPRGCPPHHRLHCRAIREAGRRGGVHAVQHLQLHSHHGTGVLGLGPIHLTDGVAQPMADVFDITQAAWTFTAVPAPILYTTTLPLPPQTGGLRIPKPTHDAQYWARVTKGMDFSDADRVNPQAFNRILWKGLKGDTLYPGDANVAETRNRYKEALREKTSQAPTDRDGD